MEYIMFMSVKVCKRGGKEEKIKNRERYDGV